jgi:hypothetical protein
MTGNSPRSYGSLPAALRETIDSAIAALERSEYRAFLERFAHPDELADVLAGRSIERLAASLAGAKADALIEVLRSLQGLEFDLADDETQVAFRPKKNRPHVVLEKQGESWYFRNARLVS